VENGAFLAHSGCYFLCVFIFGDLVPRALVRPLYCSRLYDLLMSELPTTLHYAVRHIGTILVTSLALLLSLIG